MKKTEKILTIAFMTIVLVMIATNVFAGYSSVLNSMKNQNANTTKLTQTGGKLITILQTVGIIASVLVIIVLGIKYMMGSAEEKAEYKKTFIPYIIGAVLILAASTFAGMIFEFASGL